MDSFKIRMHKYQSDNQDLCGGNPQKMGSENPWPRPSTLTLYPETSFAVMHSSYSYSKSPSHLPIPYRSRDGEGGLSNLSGYVLVEHWLWVRVSFWLTRALNISKSFLWLLGPLYKNISVPTGKDRVIMEERLWPLTVKFLPKSVYPVKCLCNFI